MTKANNSDKLLRQIITLLGKGSAPARVLDFGSAKDLIGAAANWAGKGKDEVVQMICREIGVATAAVLAEPINQIVENRKLTITFELTPKGNSRGQTSKKAKRVNRSKKVSSS